MAKNASTQMPEPPGRRRRRGRPPGAHSDTVMSACTRTCARARRVELRWRSQRVNAVTQNSTADAAIAATHGAANRCPRPRVGRRRTARPPRPGPRTRPRSARPQVKMTNRSTGPRAVGQHRPQADDRRCRRPEEDGRHHQRDQRPRQLHPRRDADRARFGDVARRAPGARTTVPPPHAVTTAHARARASDAAARRAAYARTALRVF